MQPWPIIARKLAQLQNMANPPSGSGYSEAVPWVSYDTETYVSTATTELRFFQTTKATRELSNMELAGQYPAPQFFELYGIGLDILTPPQATALSASLDVWGAVFGTGTAGQGGPIATVSVSSKEQFQIPLSFLHGSGGPMGFGWSEAANAAASGAEWANNSLPDGGFPISGSILIPPTVGFSVVLDWPAAVTLSADRDLRAYLYGTLHRRIL